MMVSLLCRSCSLVENSREVITESIYVFVSDVSSAVTKRRSTTGVRAVGRSPELEGTLHAIRNQNSYVNLQLYIGMVDKSRRRVLVTVGSGLAVSTAGCLSDDDTSAEDNGDSDTSNSDLDTSDTSDGTSSDDNGGSDENVGGISDVEDEDRKVERMPDEPEGEVLDPSTLDYPFGASEDDVEVNNLNTAHRSAVEDAGSFTESIIMDDRDFTMDYYTEASDDDVAWYQETPDRELYTDYMNTKINNMDGTYDEDMQSWNMVSVLMFPKASPVEWYFDLEYAELNEHGEEVLVYRATVDGEPETETEEENRDRLPQGDVTYLDAELVMTTDGLVKSFFYEYSHETSGDGYLEYKIYDIGSTTVEEPDWIDNID